VHIHNQSTKSQLYIDIQVRKVGGRAGTHLQGHKLSLLIAGFCFCFTELKLHFLQLPVNPIKG
jgi:hypothetical protein